MEVKAIKGGVSSAGPKLFSILNKLTQSHQRYDGKEHMSFPKVEKLSPK